MTAMSSPRHTIEAWAAKQLEAVNAEIAAVENDAFPAAWEAKMNLFNTLDLAGVRSALSIESDMMEASLSYRHTLRLRFFAMDLNGSPMAYESMEDAVGYYKANRIPFVVNRAIWLSVIESIAENAGDIGWTRDDGYMYLSVASYSAYKTLLEHLVEIKVIQRHLSEELVWVNNFINRQQDAQDRIEKQNKGDSGLAAKINSNRNKEVDGAVIEEQIQKWQGEISNMLVARTWGWEVEAPNPGDDVTVPAGVEKGSDGSVESYEADHDGCECGCRDCNYHDCSCDDCENYNDDPQHCGYDDCSTCSSYEFRTTGGIPRALHPGLKKLLAQISETEKNDSAGTHIHVYARDLEAYQIGIVLGGYALTQRVWDVIAGRDVDNDGKCRQYAGLIPGDHVSFTLRQKKLYHVGKFNAVNTLHVTNDRGTLEFRQMDCNFDYDRITFMAWMVRGLVEVAKRGATITEFFNITDVEGFIKLYAKYGFTTFQETDVIDDPMGSRYNQSRNRIEAA